VELSSASESAEPRVTRDIPITVGILTRNSVCTLAAAVRSVNRAAEIVVCDGASTDGTRELALALGCLVIDQDKQHLDAEGRLIDIAGVREQVVRAASWPWIFFLDSDEVATPMLMNEIAEAATVTDGAVGAYRVPRLYVVGGNLIRSASTYPSYQMRVVHKDSLVGYHGLVHDQPVLREGIGVGTFTHAQLVPQPPLRELWRKWRAYMRLEEVKKADFTRREWIERAVVPGLASARWHTLVYLRVLRRGPSPRMPVRYEMLRIAYEFGVIYYTGRRFLGLGRPNVERAWGSDGPDATTLDDRWGSVVVHRET
jgi:glycosyltransferase involved in cell wall biosynthesis